MTQTQRLVDALHYPIIVSMDGTAELAGILAAAACERAFVALDPRVRARSDAYASALRAAGIDVIGSHELAAGERVKRMATVEKLLRVLVATGADRRTALIAVGGGSITDVTGFCSSIYMRGAPWVAVATTGLGMVDAAIGGKTGVNLPEGKNLAGTFWDPLAVIADLPSLATLPLAAKRAGLAEAIKAAVVARAELLTRIERFSLRARPEAWCDIVAEAASVKAEIVKSDPRDVGRRAALNFGHTVGHALEFASGFRLRHGDAVAAGMRAEGLIAQGKGWWPPDQHARLLRALTRMRLPVTIDGLDESVILTGMRRDKKRAGTNLKFTLPVRIGEMRVEVDVAEEEIRRALRACAQPPSGAEVSA